MEEESSRIFGYEDTDSHLVTSCRVYEHDDAVRTVQLHADGHHNGFLYAEKSLVTVVLDGTTEVVMKSPQGSHRSHIVHVMYLNEREVLSASQDGGVNLWAIREEEKVLEWKNYLSGSRNHLTALRVTNSEHHQGSIVATTKDGYLSVWSRDTLMPVLSAANGNAPCLDTKGLYSVELFETANLLVVGGYGRIYVHEDTAETLYSHVTTLGGHKGPVLALASLTMTVCEGDGTATLDLIISGGEDKELIVWNTRLFEEHIRRPCAHGSSINSIAILDTTVGGLCSTPLLASCSRDGLIRLWTMPSLTLMHEIKAHVGLVQQVSSTLRYSRFNNRPALLSTGSDKRVKVWKIYRILNWERRKPFALFLAYCRYIKSSPIFMRNNASPCGVVSEEPRRAVECVFHEKFMCMEIISFL